MYMGCISQRKFPPHTCEPGGGKVHAEPQKPQQYPKTDVQNERRKRSPDKAVQPGLSVEMTTSPRPF